MDSQTATEAAKLFTFHVDLGQIIISGLIGVVGYLIKRQIDSFESRINKHESVLFQMNGDIQAIIGHLGVERRKLPRINND